ncbi:hypothetical protein CV728_08240 [Helicobacter pylori]|uniref:VASP tetramerisation domain protein n=1 Tax=Helicobacter pylori TaxID=210 RepID=A0A518YH65_HELPX|nr:hypothetical protein [Helicobacter pylori]QDY61423.1 hypothetical protein CV728_08240 [Helicobacter pylori]
MRLYNKIQELISETETLKQKNNEVLGLARNELSELVNQKSNENLESLKNTFQGYLNGKLVEMPLIVKKNVKELVNKQALTEEVRNELLSLFDKQAITNALKQELKHEIESKLDNLLSDSELNSELKQARHEIVTETTSKTISALTSKILGALEGKVNAIIESVIKNLDFSFLRAQPKAFYSVINENLKEIFLKELESEYLQKYINSVIESYFKQEERLKLLRETELQALCYLQVALEINKVKMLQDALILENQNTQNELKIQNEIAYNLKRKELTAEGKLEDEAFRQCKFKII